MKIHLLFFVTALFFGCIALQAQDELAIGQWRSHLPYRVGKSVTQSNNTVYFATPWAVVALDKSDNSTEFLTKVNTLNDVGVRKIKYHQGFDLLLVIYDNSNIDLVYSDGVVNLPFIKNFSFTGLKTVNDIFFDGSNAFLSASFGIVKLNLERAEVDFTTFTGDLAINTFTRWNGYYYAATDEGVLKATVDHPNLADFSAWDYVGAEEGFPPVFECNAIAVFNDRLYVDIDNTIFRYDGNSLDSFFYAGEDKFYFTFFSQGNGRLIAGMKCNTGCLGRAYLLQENGESQLLQAPCVTQPVYAVEDEKGNLWFADDWSEFRKVEADGACETFSYNSPHTSNIYEMTVAGNGDLWIASGGINPNQTYRWRSDGIFYYIDGEWGYFNRNNTDAFKIDDGLFDFLDVAVEPNGEKVYASSFLDGLVEFDGTDFTVYNDRNSNLQNAPGDPTRTRVAGIDFDADGNLWICNHQAPAPVSVLKPDGSWKSFGLVTSSRRYLDVTVDPNGFKWFVLGTSGTEPILVLDTGQDIDDTSDDRQRIIRPSDTELPNGSVSEIVVDLNGDVWVGTAEGAVVFECGSGVFESSCRGTRRIVEVGGFNGYLLETERVNAIAVDGANRKWFGTNNGVFVMNAAGDEQVVQYTADNSPLLDNTVLDIAIDQQSGIVYIGTASGLVSLRGDAVEGGIRNSSNVSVFPNPVRPEYVGPIAIKGLARDANVKITNVNGQLVYETTALGGQAIWNGTDYNGRRVNTGVYLVFSTSSLRPEDPDAVVAKVVFIK